MRSRIRKRSFPFGTLAFALLTGGILFMIVSSPRERSVQSPDPQALPDSASQSVSERSAPSSFFSARSTQSSAPSHLRPPDASQHLGVVGAFPMGASGKPPEWTTDKFYTKLPERLGFRVQTEARKPLPGTIDPCRTEAGGDWPRHLEGFRAGLTEIFENKENGNRILLAKTTWAVNCQIDNSLTMFSSTAEVAFEGKDHFRLRLHVRLEASGLHVGLVEVERLAGSRAFQLLTLELRQQDQRRGNPFRGRFSKHDAGVLLLIDTDADADSIADFSRQLRSSQWLDVPMRFENRPFLLTVELPDPGQLGER